MFKRFLDDEVGATAIEYALVASLISVAILTAMKTLSTNTQQMFETLAAATSEANGGGPAPGAPSS